MERMQVVFDRDAGRVWCDTNIPVVYCVITKAPSKEQLCDMASDFGKLIAELTGKYHYLNAITDLSTCPLISPALVKFYSHEIVPGQISLGLRHMAFVLPAEKRALRQFLNSFIQIRHLPVSLHSNLAGARKIVLCNRIETK